MSTATATNPAPGFAKHPGYRIVLKPAGRRMRVLLDYADRVEVRVAD